MEYGIIEAIMVAIITLVMPILGARETRRILERIRRGETSARIGTYRNTILTEWVSTAVVLTVWLVQGRSLIALGFGFPDASTNWIVNGVALAVCAVLVVQTIWVVGAPERLAKVKQQFAALGPLLPHTKSDARWWNGLSVTAGVCEEIIYRGFILAVVGSWIGIWPAVVATSVIFGLCHIYQGPVGAVRAGVVGLVLGAVFIGTGSLWAPIVLHIVLDVTAGHMARRAIEIAPAPPLAA